MKAFLIVLCAIGSVAGVARAETSDRACEGWILHDGASIQVCYPRELGEGWRIEGVVVDPARIVEMYVGYERSVCVKRSKDGSCRVRRMERAATAIISRRGMSLREGARFVGRLLGMPRITQAGSDYRLSRKASPAVMLLSRVDGHARLFIMHHAKHGWDSEVRAARAFAERLSIRITAHP